MHTPDSLVSAQPACLIDIVELYDEARPCKSMFTYVAWKRVHLFHAPPCMPSSVVGCLVCMATVVFEHVGATTSVPAALSSSVSLFLSAPLPAVARGTERESDRDNERL